MEPIFFKIEQAVAIITLNRPQKFNAFNREMALLFQQKLDDCQADNIRAVYITGMGKAFCAGQDLEEVIDTNAPGMDRILKEHFNPIIEKIWSLQKPVIAAVNGVAAGAGANIALSCDIVVAAASANFIQAFSKIGLVPDSGGTFMLPRLIGWQKASALMMTGDKVPAAEAERMGMIYKVFTDDYFGDESKQLAFRLAQMPTKGLALTKKALQLSASNTLVEQLATEDEMQQQAAETNDFKEGVHAFIEKRTPVFKGN